MLVVFLTVFIDLLGFGIVLPLLPLYAKQFAGDMSGSQLGLTIGLLMASFSAMQFLFSPLWGRLSDRVGRRPVLLLGLLGSTLSYAGFAYATLTHNLAAMFAARIGAGICGATIATAQAYIADVTTLETRARGMALIGAAFGLGFTFGPLFGAATLISSDASGLSPWPGYVAAGFSAAALLLAYFRLQESLRPESRPAEASWFHLTALRDALGTPSIAALLFTSFVSIFSFANFESTVSLFLKDEKTFAFDLPKVLLVFAYIGLMLSLAQGFLVRRLATRIAEATMATAGAAVAIVGFVLMTVASQRADLPLLLVALAVEVTGFAFVNPSLQSLLSRRSDPTRQGGILGLAQGVSSLARIAGPLAGNYLFQSVAPTAPYWFAAALMAVACLLIAYAARSGRDYRTPPGRR